MEEKSRSERVQQMALMLSRARNNVGKSQLYMANEMGVSLKTIQNWEKGISCPDFFDSIEWFRILHINPLRYFLELMYPNEFEHLSPQSNDSQVEDALKTIIDNLPASGKRGLLFMLDGQHGASPNALIQLILAYLHTPLSGRLMTAYDIAMSYDISCDMGVDICRNNVQPNLDVLHGAITQARNAATKKSDDIGTDFI